MTRTIDERVVDATQSTSSGTDAPTSGADATCTVTLDVAGEGRTTMTLGEFVETCIVKVRLPESVRDGLNRGIHLDLERAEAQNDKQGFYQLVVDGWENLVLFHIDMSKSTLAFPNWAAWYDGFMVEGSAMYFEATPPGLTTAQIERFGA